LVVAIVACSSTPATSQSQQASEIDGIIRQAMEANHLKAVIVKVTKGDTVVTERAYGESMTAVPATTEMHFRNGAVAFAYVSNLLLQFVDEKKVTLDDTIDRWMPTLPEADKVTLKMLANQTSGYPDFETDPGWNAAFNADPFHIFTFEERLNYAFSRPMQFAPGTNWSYAHTNFMILGEILAKIGGKPLEALLREKVLEPMDLTNTNGAANSQIPSPVLHTFSSERKGPLGVPPTSPLYEEATFWNTQWGTPMGADETTTIDDLITTAVAIGTGKLLSKFSYEAMTAPNLVGFGQTQENCLPSCFPQTNVYNFGLGVVRSGSWLLQDPLLSGLAVLEAYLPSEEVAIAIAATLLPAAFDPEGNYPPNPTNALFQSVGAVMAPNDPPPKPS
jgi:CubicO group peptidase (beta-lactamase class C family)